MKIETFEIFLESLLVKMDKNETSRQRAENLLELIEFEYEKMKQNSNLILSRNESLVEMFNAMNNIETLELLDYAKEIIINYIKTSKFDLIPIPFNSQSKNLSKNINFINNKLREKIDIH